MNKGVLGLTFPCNTPLNILFLGETRLPDPFHYTPYSYYYYKYLKRFGHNVITVGTYGDLPFTTTFGYYDLMPQLQMLQFQPDLVLFVESYPLLERFDFKSLQRCSTPKAFLSLDTALQASKHLQIASTFDYLFVAHPEYLKIFERHCPKIPVHVLQYACDPEVHRMVPALETADLAFIGTWSNPLLYQERRDYLNRLSGLFRCEFYENCSESKIAKVYSRTKLLFNYAPLNGVNSRVVETLCYGKLLLTNHSAALRNLFTHRRHLVYYRDFSDLVKQIRHYLSATKERQAIAAQGQQLVHRSHTFVQRIVQILQVVDYQFKKGNNQFQTYPQDNITNNRYMIRN